MSGDSRLLAAIFVGGLLLFLASFWKSNLGSGAHILTIEKAEEMQAARRKLHSLNHQYAHYDEESQAGQSTNQSIAVLPQVLQDAEADFNRLKDEIDTIRASRPWLAAALCYGGLTLMIACGLFWISRCRSPVPSDTSHSAISSLSRSHQVSKARDN